MNIRSELYWLTNCPRHEHYFEYSVILLKLSQNK